VVQVVATSYMLLVLLALKSHVEKLPMYLFFYIALEEVILMRANKFLGPVEGMGPETLDFCGPLKGQ